MEEERRTYIVRYGEVALKGENKPYFERLLMERMRKLLKKYEGVEVRKESGLVFIRTPLDLPQEAVTKEMGRVFGIDSISPAIELPSDMDVICEAAAEYMLEQLKLRGFRTFKVEAKRSDKSFPVTSPEIGRIVGASVLKACKVLRVDVHHPDVLLYVHVRQGKSFLFESKLSGQGGLPLGVNGRGLVLLSGGIDSPVAAFLMAKRGMMIEAVHFNSYPYTSERAWEKIQALARILARYTGRVRITSVNMLPIQEEINERCPEELMTLLLRRFMLRVAEAVAQDRGCQMLITGESLGQVASQTADALVVTDQTVQMPVMRPLIGMDKMEIVALAEKIGTFETSIQPYEDCCTVFLPKHPSTRPRLARVLEAEACLDAEAMVAAVLAEKEVVTVFPEDE